MKFIPTSRAMVVNDAMKLIADNYRLIIISINEESGVDFNPPTGLPNVSVPMLTLNFADISRRVGNHKMFDEIMSNQIFFFVDIQKNADICLVHCHAGVSRSPAVCAGLSLHYNKKCDEYFEKYEPNLLVFYRMVEQSYKLKTKRHYLWKFGQFRAILSSDGRVC